MWCASFGGGGHPKVVSFCYINMKDEPRYYAIIPSDVRYSKIPPNAKLLYGEITALCNKDGFCWASNKYFSNLYDVADGTISEWIRVLRDNGFITYEIKENNIRKIFLMGVSGNPEGGIRKNRRGVSGNPEHNNTVSITDNKKRDFSSLKETLGTAEEYQPDHHSPLDEKKKKNALAKKLGLVKTSPKIDFMYQVGNDFLKGYEYYTGVKYVGNVHLEQVARNLSTWFNEGETRETMQEMIDAFFEGKKGRDTVATPTAVFSPHTYNAWKQNRL